MQLSDFDYDLPKNMIAQKPEKKRDQSKLFLLELAKDDTNIKHLIFNEIIDILKAADTLVVNDSRVVNARLFAQKPTGGKLELLVLNPHSIEHDINSEPAVAECLIKGKVRPDLEIDIKLNSKKSVNLKARIMEQISGGRYKVEFNIDLPLTKFLAQYGSLPLPPYIKHDLKTPQRYQTIYSKNNGSVAAPTAGLHFTPELLKALERNGISIAYVTLHVSYGTFTPVRADDVRTHKMEQEYAILTPENAKLINQAHTSKAGRLIAVGTTTVRTLESVAKYSASKANRDKIGELQSWEGWTELFIYPGFNFKAGIDILITNFHLPRSTLLMLVSAFAGRENILKAYQEAIKKNYRFYSLGDAMMIVK